MNCTECQEKIATAARDQLLPPAAEHHQKRCRSCRAFAEDLAAVAEALSSWTAPPASVLDVVTLETKVASRMRQEPSAPPHPRLVARLIESPAAMALGGAAALAAGVGMAPPWVQQAAAGWVIIAAIFVSLVLVHHSRRSASEGEPSC
jgi:hypothetical protein